MFRVSLILALTGCAMSHHPTVPFEAPAPQWATLEEALANPVEMEVDVIVSARWQVEQSGLIDLNHPRAAHLTDERVPIDLPIVRIRHPKGTFFVDTGVDRQLASGEGAPVRGVIKGFVKDIEPLVSLGALMDAEPTIGGILMTHFHIDHVLGLPDVPKDVDVFAGPDDLGTKAWMHAFVGGTYATLLADRPPLLELQPEQGIDFGGIAGTLDLLGDGSIWALPAPGHTHGSTVYFLNTETPVLVLGDASHTCWGWNHDVPPGTFSHDRDGAAQSFLKLRRWAAQIDDLVVVAGHTACEV